MSAGPAVEVLLAVVGLVALTVLVVVEVVEALEKHRVWLAETGTLAVRRRARAAAEIEAIAFAVLRSRFGSLHGDSRIAALADRVVDGSLDPFAAADELWESVE